MMMTNDDGHIYGKNCNFGTTAFPEKLQSEVDNVLYTHLFR
jgi:hypothetical protein